MAIDRGDRTPAPAEEIRRIVGPLEDAVIARIRATGATASEVLEAYMWATADDSLGEQLGRSKRGVVGEVYEILASELVPPEEDR